MNGDNGFFKRSDRRADSIRGYDIDPLWWSRCYEYPWAIQYAEVDHMVADMGCGYPPRPFKTALADICKMTYAVDINPEILTLPGIPKLEYRQADFTEHSTQYLDGACFDRIFCISVFEDLGDRMYSALAHFKRILKPDGLIVMTFDVQYDASLPCEPYPGVDFHKFWNDVFDAGLLFTLTPDITKGNAVVNEGFNLCVFHCVLQHDS